jgi:hypothetical protein
MVPNGRTPWKSGVWHRVFINAIQAMMIEGIAILKCTRSGEEGRRPQPADLSARVGIGIGIGIGIENEREEERGSIPIPIAIPIPSEESHQQHPDPTRSDAD